MEVAYEKLGMLHENSRGKKMNKCPKDGKRCYIHYDSDGFEIRCRHGSCLVDSPCAENFEAIKIPEQTEVSLSK